MKFLLVYPTMVTEAPMVLGMLSAVLKEEGWETDSIVNTFKQPLKVEDFVKKAWEYEADIVGISMITFDVLFTYQIIGALKEAGFKVAVGGAHPTDCPEEVMSAGADIVVVGEGEESLREICRNPEIKGIIPRKCRLDINKLPMPDLDVFDQDLFRGEDGLIKGFHRVYTSRGCPGCCTFCDWQVFRQEFKEYNIYKVVDEVKRRRDVYGITSFSIADDCLTVNRERVLKFCELIKKLNVQWRANSRANLVDLELLKIMKDAGCHSIAFGLENGDPETLMRIGKKVTLEENIRAPKLAHEAGLEVYGCLMTGFPWEDVGHMENNIKFVHELWDVVSLFQVSGSLMPFPGTAIYRMYHKRYGFTNYWLKPKYQELGIQVYQNALNPLKVSTFYQRYLFDDTYIQKDYFFTYTKEYKKAVRRLVCEIGKHNLEFMFKGQPIKQKLIYGLSKLSMLAYDYLPNWETTIGGIMYGLFNKKSRSKVELLRDRRRGIAKSYTNPN
jgi:anaerobic magnesium-protoporphyrin IX monomethyl ester cyclase